MAPFVILYSIYLSLQLARSAPTEGAAFWYRLDASCAAVTSIAAVSLDAEPALAADRDAVVAFCRDRAVPRFAARSLVERQRRLAVVLAASGVSLPAQGTLPSPTTAGAIVRRASEAELQRNPPPELGPLGESVLGLGVVQLCRATEVKSALRATCALEGRVSLSALRLAVLRDVMDMFLERATEQPPSVAGLVAVLLAVSDPRALDLDKVFGPSCTLGAQCSAEARVTSLARAMLERLLADGPRFDRGQAHYRNVVEEVLREQLAEPSLTLPESASFAVSALVVALEALDAPRAREPAELGDAVGLVLRRALELAAALAGSTRDASAAGAALAGSYASAAEQASGIVARVVAADPRGALDRATSALATMTSRGKLPEASVRALRIAASLAAATSEADVKRISRAEALPLPPWLDRFVFDINAAPPINKRLAGSSELALNGDLTLGYNGDRFGIVGSGGAAYYELEQAGNSALTERYAGTLDAWALFDIGKGVRLEPRLAGGAIYYGTLASDSLAGTNRQTNQDSIFGRGVASLGVRVQPGARVAFSLAAGAGGQYEDYFRVLQTSVGDQGTVFNSAVTVRYEGRARLQVVLWPEVLSFRARADLQAFDMRRSDQAVTFSVGRVTQNQQGVTEISQIELFGRGFLDADIARFFGFVPSLHGGANVFSFSSNGVGSTVVVPVAGIGIRRDAP